MNFSNQFNALSNEAQFTGHILADGVTQIRKANYAFKGIYFQSFTSLSTGFERIGKLCLILDYCIDNNGNYPSNNFMKNEIGHNINRLYKKSQEITEKYNFKYDFMQNLESDIHRIILDIITSFAKGDRYSNIDLITDNKNYEDPIKRWNKQVDKYIYENLVSENKKQKIESDANLIEELCKDYIFVQHFGEDEEQITSLKNASFRTGIFEAVAPYRQLFVFQIIRYFSEVLTSLQYLILKETHYEIPYFSDIFRIFYNDDKYIKSRKTWQII